MLPEGMQYFLNRKYAILQQQADATSMNAVTGSITGEAQAGLDRTRAAWLPKESAAAIAKTGAETNLIGQQAQIVVPESRARIRNMDAETSYTGTQNKVLNRSSLTPMSTLFGSSTPSLDAISRMQNPFRLGGLLGE